MKKTLAILLTVLLAISVLGCNTPAPAPVAATPAPTSAAPVASSAPTPAAEKPYIALCIAQASNEFQSQIKDAMQAYIDENKLAEQYDFTFFDADFDTATQLQQVENAIAQGADAIVMIAVDAEGSMAAVNAANEAKVPIVGCNTAVSDNSKLTSYVGSDSIQSGEIEMKALAEAMGGKGKLLEIHGTYGHEPQIFRDQGIRNILKEYPDIAIVAEDTGNWSRDEAMALVENIFQTDLSKEITAVVAHNDAQAIGAMIALEGMNRKDILIAGIDANADMLGYLKEGRVALTVFQDAAGQGSGAVAQAIKIINGETYEHDLMIPYQLVTKDNVEEFLAMQK